MSTVIARQVTKAAVPLMLLASINFFLQGHNLPGGGFIAGVMTSAAIGLIYIVFNLEGLLKLTGKGQRNTPGLVQKYLPVSGTGVGLGVGTGLVSMALGLSFLNHRKGLVHLPVYGEIHWTTAAVFDLGVYLAVVGSLLTMVEVLGGE